jgi:hypothetical protein
MSKKKKAKSVKAKGDQKPNRKNGKSDSGAAAILKAEKRLEKALRKLEDVREELREREAALRIQLVKHGRMPAEETRLSTDPFDDDRRELYALDGADDDDIVSEQAVTSVPLLDQRQIIDAGSRKPIDRGE